MKRLILLISLASCLSGFAQWTIIENQTFTSYGGAWYDSSYVIVRNCTFKFPVDNASFRAFNLDSCHHIIFDNCLFDSLRRTTGTDFIAINISSNCDSIVVKNCTFRNISADGIQVGLNHDPGTEYMRNIIIENNLFEVTGGLSAENAIDIKGCDNMVFRGNTVRGFRGCDEVGCNSDIGEAITIHYSATRNVLIEGNNIYNSNAGIACSVGAGGIYADNAPDSVVIRNNFIHDNEINISLFGAPSSRNIQIYHNTLGNYENYTVGTNGAQGVDTLLANNIFGYTGSYNISTDFQKSSFYHIDGFNNIWMELNNYNFVDATNPDTALRDFRLTGNDSLAVNKAVNISSRIYTPMLYDADTSLRPGGDTNDVGAFEFTPASPVDTSGPTTSKDSLALNFFKASNLYSEAGFMDITALDTYKIALGSDSVTFITGSWEGFSEVGSGLSIWDSVGLGYVWAGYTTTPRFTNLPAGTYTLKLLISKITGTDRIDTIDINGQRDTINARDNAQIMTFDSIIPTDSSTINITMSGVNNMYLNGLVLSIQRENVPDPIPPKPKALILNNQFFIINNKLFIP